MSQDSDKHEQTMSQGSNLSEGELRVLETSARPDTTKKSTDYGLAKFNEWLDKRGKVCDFGDVSATDFNDLLRKFYAEVKSAKHSSLSPSTMTCIRAAIHRFIGGPPHYRSFNLIKGDEFISSNNMFTARCKLFFKEGNAKPTHKKAIEKGDMEKLGSYFAKWKDNPDILVESVWFFLCFNFGRRGREGWTTLFKDSFAVKIDSENHEFVAMAKTEITKNHQGGNKQSEQGYSNEKMYGPGVEIFKFYISKLNVENQRLFQHPLKSYKLDGAWFRNEPIGKNTIGTMMQRISKKAGLSSIYTCHSVRASTITTLYQAGINPQSIISITKHKNVSSLGHYISDLSDGQKRDCSGILTSALSLNLPGKLPDEKIGRASATTVTAPIESTEPYAIPTFVIGIEDIIQVPASIPKENTVPNSNNEEIEIEVPNSQLVPYVGATNNEAIDLVMQSDGTVVVPSSDESTVFTIQLPSPTKQPVKPKQPNDLTSSLFSNAVFHGCTFNIKQ